MASASGDRSLVERVLAPRPFLLGVVLAFAACCLGGWLAGRHNPYRPFVRFHPAISIETLHYATASQLLALAREACPADRIAVVISGNSILYGTGQRADRVWSRELQRLLGDGYRVLNLAVPAGQLGEFGSVAAELLAREHPRVIHLSITSPAREPPAFLDARYSFVFWDASFKSLLTPHPLREAIARDLVRLWSRTEKAEMVRQMRLDRWLYFRDLWAWVAHEHVSTVWTAPLGERSFWPRRRLGDETQARPALRPSDPRVPSLLADVRQTCASPYDDPAHIARCVRGCCAAVPEGLRRQTLLLLIPQNPFLLARVPAPDCRRYHRAYSLLQRELEASGFATLQVRDLTPPDYSDTKHLTEAGGTRLAAQAAPRVRELARALGYDSGPRGQ